MALQYFDITDPLYGGSTNPLTDNYQPITDAIADAQAAGGGVVFLPHGRFKTTRTILMRDVQNIVLTGSGPGTVLYLDNTQSPVQDVIQLGDTPVPPPTPPLPTTATTRNIVIERMTIDRAGGLADAGTAGVRIFNSQYTRLLNLEFHNHGAAVFIDNYYPWLHAQLDTTEISIVDTNIVPRRGPPISPLTGANGFPLAGIYAGNCSNLKIQNVFIEPTYTGIHLDKGSNGVLLNQTTIVNGGPYAFGVRMGGYGFCRYITGCIIENAEQAQIFIESGWSVHVSNCWLGAGNGPEAAPNRRGVLIQPGVKDVAISNCRIGHQSQAGVHTLGDHVVITGNVFNECVQASGQGTIIVQDADHTNVTNNNIRDGGSPAIMVLGSSDYTVVTGNDAAGQGFLNAATGVNLIAPTGSNFV